MAINEARDKKGFNDINFSIGSLLPKTQISRYRNVLREKFNSKISETTLAQSFNQSNLFSFSHRNRFIFDENISKRFYLLKFASGENILIRSLENLNSLRNF